MVYDLRERTAGCVHIENHFDGRSGSRVDNEFFIRACQIAERSVAAYDLTFCRTLRLSSADVLGKLQAIVFRESLQDAFQNHALRCIRDRFGDVLHAHAVLLAFQLIDRQLLTVASESVHFPDEDDAKLLFRRIA